MFVKKKKNGYAGLGPFCHAGSIEMAFKGKSENELVFTGGADQF